MGEGGDGDGTGRVSYRCLLALDGGAVEAEGGNVVGVALDVKDALVVPLARLGLGEVLGSQRDRLGHPNRDVDLGGGQDLRTVLRRGERGGSIKSGEQEDEKKPNTCLLMGGKRRERWRGGSDWAPESLSHIQPKELCCDSLLTCVAGMCDIPQASGQTRTPHDEAGARRNSPEPITSFH